MASRYRAKSGQPVVGLALSGGFARGVAHLGVLKVLEENGIPIHAIAGISAGSIIAGAYASGTSVEEMIEGASRVRLNDLAGWTLSRMGLASNARMEPFLRRLFRVTTFEQLRIPLTVVATDLVSGQPVLFRTGDIIGPVRASCAYPGFFLPVRLNGRTLIDGAFSGPVPVEPLVDMGVTHIIAVHLITSQSREPTNLFRLINQCFSLMQARDGSDWRRTAHAVIEPDLAEYAWDDFGRARQMIAAGEAATRAVIGQIRTWLRPGNESAKLVQPVWRPALQLTSRPAR